MAETWVVCIDGTWNQPGQKDVDPVTEEESSTSSNVAKTWEAMTQETLDKAFHYGTIAPLYWDQGADYGRGEVVYFTGIGTTGTYDKYVEGSTGSGTSERIRDAYRYLAERYRDGDRIYLFGFSRGAFAARSLAGLIDFAGLPQRRRALKEEELYQIYARYRKGEVRPIGSGMRPVQVDFLGLWDTVGALAFDSTLNNYHRLNPGGVRKVAHALALDELRSRFPPVYWDSPPGSDTQVSEAWFSGAHSNIGGGYPDPNLSNIAWFWVLRNAREAGLTFEPRALPGFDREMPTGIRRNSYIEFYSSIKLVGTLIHRLGLKEEPRRVRIGQRLHESVLERIREGSDPGISQSQAYKPCVDVSGMQIPDQVEPWGQF